MLVIEYTSSGDPGKSILSRNDYVMDYVCFVVEKKKYFGHWLNTGFS